MARVNEGSVLPATHVYPQVEWNYLILLRSRRASPHLWRPLLNAAKFGWRQYSSAVQ